MTSGADTFEDRVTAFARDVSDLIARTVVPSEPCGIQITSSENNGQPRALVELRPDTDARYVTVRIGGNDAAGLTVRIGCRPDSSGRYMAATESAFAIYSTLDRTPLFRLDYREAMRSAPSSHWQVHAERGALSNLLTIGGHNRPHNLAALHIPVGGARLRPGLEDFLQFVIDELGADSREGWRDVLNESRATWRRRQIASAVRDVPDEAVRVLRLLGYSVEPPGSGDGRTRDDTLYKW
ncbi:MAG: hypothetical protein CL424_08295 [Acidimicrobiaceae bacterium]|nr:hypothetical protein [Acidimicrobiaceae bacterium]